MKMSDVFDGEVVQDGDTLLAKGYGELADFSGYKKEARYVAHAVNNHDRMVEENKKLRDFAMYCQGFLGCEESRDSIALHGITINAKDLLAKLNQEGEE